MSPRPTSSRAVRRIPWQQFTILAMVRFAEPIANTSVFPYLPAMIASFDGVKPADIGFWTGTAAAIFSLAQCVTAIPWGRMSDRMGRKPVILMGLFNTMLTSLLWGVSGSLPMALFVRAMSGAGNGNVGIIRTMVAELCPWKELQPRAFSIMPLVYSIGSVIGPTIGGAFANPLHRPSEDRTDGPLLWKYPYALPNIINACFFLSGITVGILFLHETLESKRGQRDWGLVLGQKVVGAFNFVVAQFKHMIWRRPLYTALPMSPGHARSRSADDLESKSKREASINEAPPTYSSVLTKQTVLYLIVYTVLAMHNSGFDQIISVLLHHPRNGGVASAKTILPFRFNRGFGLDTGKIGVLFTINGFVGIFIQFVLFPPAARYFGTLNCLRIMLSLQPIIYFLLPYSALIEDPVLAEISFIAMWTLKSLCAIMSFPCCTILLTNSATSLKVLGTVNGIATSISAIGRALGPTLTGSAFTWGVKNDCILAPFAILSFMGIIGLPPLIWAKEGDGFGNDGNDSSLESEEDHFADDEDDDAVKLEFTRGRKPMVREEYDESKDGASLLESNNQGMTHLKPYDVPSSAVLTDTEDDEPTRSYTKGAQFLNPSGYMVAPRLGRTAQQPRPGVRRRSSTPLGMGPGFRRLSSNLGVTRSGLGSGSEMG